MHWEGLLGLHFKQNSSLHCTQVPSFLSIQGGEEMSLSEMYWAGLHLTHLQDRQVVCWHVCGLCLCCRGWS